MGYKTVHEIMTSPRAAGDLFGMVEIGFAVRAWTRVQAIATGDDQREVRIVQQVFSGNIPVSWVMLAVARLDAAGKLPAPTDADIDTAVAATWDRLVKAG